ncbi:ROK family transcriptional regulator [Thetidibacter halocola]|uniref:ROK family transcriptional regulator n=1 Tax=Thetidibacter halocola TaxID=2827239 RepID=A0A8J7WDX2_9RHOB|nr:ROK family transcriptional regulator [Thetidibacter halocola]MBS0124977.1 ROK family transcriptional regulator [Thetidibacter halocola]
MRAHNERLVLTILRRHGPMAKAGIARTTGLSAQTVSVIMRKLEGEGLLTRDAPVRGKVGQPSVPMRLAPDGALFLGLKVGRRSVELVLTDFLGRVRSRAMRVHAYPMPEDTVRFAITQIEAILRDLSRQERARVAGLGIGMPFFLWNWAQHLGVPEGAMDAWRDADIRAEIAAALDFPVFLENDASTACGAELVFGPYEGAKDFLYFYIGYFIGGGVVLNGKLFTGRGNAGALGPCPVPDGKGGTTQLLEVASLSVLERRLREAGHETAVMWESAEGWALDQAIVDAWVHHAAGGLAHAIAAACSVMDFEAVRIDGWMPPALRGQLVDEVHAAMRGIDLSGLTVPAVSTGSVGPDARALGAASLPLSQRFLIE